MRYLPHTQYVLQLEKRTDDQEVPLGLPFRVGASFHNVRKYKEAE